MPSFKTAKTRGLENVPGRRSETISDHCGLSEAQSPRFGKAILAEVCCEASPCRWNWGCASFSGWHHTGPSVLWQGWEDCDGGPAACPQPVGPHSASLCGLVAGFLWPVCPLGGWSFRTLFGSSELMSPKGRGLVPHPSLPSLMARACGLYVGTCFNPCRSRGHQEHVALGLPGRVTHWQEN